MSTNPHNHGPKAATPESIGEVRQVLLEARGLLRFQGELGLAGLSVPKGLLAPISRRQQEPAGHAGQIPPATPASKEMVQQESLQQGAATVAAEAVIAADLAACGNLPELEKVLGNCRRCKLCSTRTHIVFGVGDPNARLMFIGEAPGRDEDLQGEPFVGAAGKLLDKMIIAMGLRRGQVYIANIVKCRPPKNRNPQDDEISQCEPFLRQQIRIVQPHVIVAMGSFAVQSLLRDSTPVSKQRGRWRQYEGIAVMPTYHPAYLLRNPAEKRPVWQDLQHVMARLSLKAEKLKAAPPPPAAGGSADGPGVPS